MSKIKVIVPTIKYDDVGFNQILKVMEIVTSNPKQNFDFDFSSCARLDHHGVVVLGGLAGFVNYHNSITERSVAALFSSNVLSSAGVMFIVDSMSELIRTNLINNNFLSHYTQSSFSGYPKGDYIGYREHKRSLDADNIAEHLNEQWLSDEKVSLSLKLKEAIVSRIFEIFMNAYGHGASIQHIEKLGVYSCGQYDKKEKKLNLSVLDFGPGIIYNVKKHNSEISDDLEAMKWALTRGNSTKTDSKGLNIPRGLGFDLLSEFVRLNGGEMRIYSNNVYAKINEGKEYEIDYSKHYIAGTLVSIKINCDNKMYLFQSEKESTQFQYF